MISALLGGIWWWGAPPPPPDDAHTPRGVVLSAAVATAALGADRPAMTLQADQIVSVLATSTTAVPGTAQDWLAWPMLLVSDGARTGWVSAEHVATEQTWAAADWPGEHISRRDVGGGTLWSAAHTGHEIDDEDGVDWLRAATEGWLVMERGGHVERLPLVRDSGWGSGRWVTEVVWRDLTGDGTPEALIAVQETVSEVGADGHTLHVIDLTRAPLAPLLSIPVDDPPWSHVGSRERLGWVDVFVEEARIEKTAIFKMDSADGVRLGLLVEDWIWDGAAFFYGNTLTPVVATLTAGPTHAAPGGPVTAQREAQEVSLDEIEGRFIEGGPLWVLVRAPDKSALGWVPSARLHFEAPLMQSFFAPQPPEPVDYLRYDWER